MTASDPTSEPAGSLRQLQRLWLGALEAALGLSPQSFRPARPAGTLDGTDAGLWAYLDTLPSAAPAFAGPDAGGLLFSAEFAALVARLEVAPGLLEEAIGRETYAAWAEYLAEQTPQPTQVSETFRGWASVHAPSALAAGLSALSEAAFFEEAQAAASGEKPATFVGGYAALSETLAASSSYSFIFEPSAPSAGTDAAGTDAAGADGPDEGGETYGLWLGNSDSARLGRVFASGAVRIEADFGACLTWVSVPGRWYNSSLLNVAYSDRESPPWRPGPGPGWDDFFGPSGSLRLLVASLLVGDSARLTVTSDAAFEEEDRRLVIANAGLGLWPLYAPDGEGVTTQVSFDSSGRLTAEIASAQGRPLVLGANVLDIATYLGHSAAPS